MTQSLTLSESILMPAPRRTKTTETSVTGAAALAAIEVDLRLAALHEAGHACISYCLGLEPKLVDASLRDGGATHHRFWRDGTGAGSACSSATPPTAGRKSSRSSAL